VYAVCLAFCHFVGSWGISYPSSVMGSVPRLCTAVYAFANISGAHINPAVTFALICTGHMRWWKGLLYMIAQVWPPHADRPDKAQPVLVAHALC
jgi:glycerol uptake facilitator-like aquaporin